MNQMLASVNSLKEALIALQADIDIIDLKQPKLGALGALDVQTVATIVRKINHQKPLSATIGDLPMQANIISSAVKQMAATDVDYIKIGFFPAPDWTDVIAALKPLTENLKLIAVLFADQHPNLNSIPQFSTAGFHGIMLDTMNKSSGSLTQVMDFSKIEQFVNLAKQNQLFCGLAGSLRVADIPQLLTLKVDYLGFRGALCANHQRTEVLDYHAIQAVKSALHVKTAASG